jgi:hypothetical protein
VCTLCSPCNPSTTASLHSATTWCSAVSVPPLHTTRHRSPPLASMVTEQCSVLQPSGYGSCCKHWSVVAGGDDCGSRGNDAAAGSGNEVLLWLRCTSWCPLSCRALWSLPSRRAVTNAARPPLLLAARTRTSSTMRCLPKKLNGFCMFNGSNLAALESLLCARQHDTPD